ncbi:MAG: carbohydrate-binding domain-containing protein [Bacteroides sp.]|nr:carbohydrate-binding domain-containing protein [Roseburia sp.]MCM1346452.1 carbohydrate-binding domain-containing protein [Bacteroides sp.]MCM1421037.1 carbohydrate-binding domain-containing protein [Bacteroides sp.]
MHTKVISAILTVAFATVAEAQNYLYICKEKQATAIEINGINELRFSDDKSSVNIAGTEYLLADVDSICFKEPVFPTEEEREEDSDGKVHIVFAENAVTVSVPSAIQGITYTTEGANLILNSANTTEDIVYELEGTSSDGSLTYYGNYKCTFILNGLSLTSQTKGALDIECGKRIAIELAEGTENMLCDAPDGTHKACLYTKGHAEFSKKGRLTVTGRTNHAIKTKEYCLIKQTTGNLTVNGAAGDGIHAGQYFKMNGGTVIIKNVAGDGIQAEITDDITDEQNGQLLVYGGYLDIDITGEEKEGIKSDSLMTFAGGEIRCNISGNGSKAIKGGTDIVIEDGTFNLTVTGSSTKTSNQGRPGGGGGWGWNRPGWEDSNDTSGSNPKGIKAQGKVVINNGDITVNTTSSGAEGIEGKNAVEINNGNIYAKTYDDCINSGGQILFNGGRTFCWATNNDAIDSNSNQSGAITINGGIVIAASAAGSPEEGMDCDNSAIKIGGGYLFTIGGAQGSAPSVPTSATAIQPTALLRSVSLTAGEYLSAFDSEGTTLFTLKIPFTMSRSYSLVSCPQFVKGSSYQLKTGTNAPADAEDEWNAFYIGGTSSASGTKKTVTFSSNYVAQ